MNAIDINLLLYAFDLDHATKGQRALQLLEQCQPHDTVLLWQVVCELGSVL